MDKFTMESSLFDIIWGLHRAYEYKQKDKYKLYLVAMDELNEEYKNKIGHYFIDPMRALSYYEKLWNI